MGDGVNGWSNGSDAEVKGRLLAELATRLGAPHLTLGIAATASPAEIRAAFLRETKALHPNRFARRPRDVRTLANELFLAVSAAYKQLAEGTKPPVHNGGFVIADDKAPPEEFDDIASSVRTKVSFKSKKDEGAKGEAAAAGRAARANGRRRRTNTQRRRLAARRGRVDPNAPTVRPGEPIIKAPVEVKQAPPPATAKSLNEVTERMAELDSARLTKFRQAIKLLKKEHFRAAKDAFRELAIEVPSERKYRVYMNYAEGMHHQSVDDADRAQVSFERALSLDARFTAASEALDNLTSRGVLSRFFRK